jgi:tRNA (guanine-N7-)-methyltransferase
MSRARPTCDLSSHLIDAALFATHDPPAWESLFGDDHPVELEVGSGKGLFLLNSAMAEPTHNFLGIELSRKYAQLAAQRLVRQEIPNAKVWPGDARIILPRHVPARAVRAVHVYFPDPWWKLRHKKRRVFTGSFVAEVQRVLEPGGRLYFASDVEEYFATMRAHVVAFPRFRELPAPQTTTPEHDLDYLTHFERKYRLGGRPIGRAVYELSAD